MSIIVNEGEGRVFSPAPSGTHQAVCFGTWDIGWQVSEWMGKELEQRKVIIGWEINELMEDGNFKGKRYTVYKRYTASLSERANLKKDLESWRGKSFTDEERKRFDVENLIGANCMLSIVHKTSVGGKTYANISSVSKLTKGMQPLAPENSKEMPEWIKKIKEKSVEHGVESVTQEETSTEDDGEKIPF